MSVSLRAIIIIAAFVIGTISVFIFWFQKSAQAPQAARIYTIGVVRTPPTLDPIWEGFRGRMKKLGYEEGRNVIYKITEIGEDYPSTKRKVAALIDQGLDLIYPIGGFAVRAAKELTEERGTSMPVVFGIFADPVAARVVKNLQNSGNNVTGVVSGNELVSSKRLELFLEVMPETKRIIFPYSDPVTTGISTFRTTAAALGVVLVEHKVASVNEIDDFLASFKFLPGDALFRATDNLLGARAAVLAEFTREKKIPLCGTNLFDVERGALMSYGPNFKKMGEQAARIVHSILVEGRSPSDIPIELPTEFELAVNLNTAKMLNIAMPPDFLAKATSIIR